MVAMFGMLGAGDASEGGDSEAGPRIVGWQTRWTRRAWWGRDREQSSRRGFRFTVAGRVSRAKAMTARSIQLVSDRARLTAGTAPNWHWRVADHRSPAAAAGPKSIDEARAKPCERLRAGRASPAVIHPHRMQVKERCFIGGLRQVWWPNPIVALVSSWHGLFQPAVSCCLVTAGRLQRMWKSVAASGWVALGLARHFERPT